MKLRIMLCIFAMFSGCSRPAPTVTFIFPRGFTGLVLISEDRNIGAELSLTNGECSITIPNNGRLVVKNLALFTHWHKEHAQFDDGKAIGAESDRNAAIWLFDLTYVKPKGCYYFVGTGADYDVVSKLYNFYELPLAKHIDQADLKQLNAMPGAH
jgi:hypothetical protein